MNAASKELPPSAALTPRAVESGPASWWRQVVLLARKDLTLDANTGRVVASALAFAAVVTTVCSLAFSRVTSETASVASAIWAMTTTFSAMLIAAKTWQWERDAHASALLLTYPLYPSAVFASKTLVVMLWLAPVQLVTLALAVLLFSVRASDFVVGAVVAALLGLPSMAAIPTLFGAMLLRRSGRELMLSTVLLPLLVPVIMTMTACMTQVAEGAAIAEVYGLLGLLLLFDLVFVGAGLVLGRALLRE